MGAETFAIMAAAGGMMKAYGEYTGGKQKQDMYDMNAGIYLRRAGATRDAAALTDEQSQVIENRIVGAQRAGYAASGVAVDTGTPLEVMVGTLHQSKLNRAIAGYNAEIEARQFESEAELMHDYGKKAAKSGKMAAFATLLDVAAGYGSTAGFGSFGGGRNTTVGGNKMVGSQRGAKAYSGAKGYRSNGSIITI